MSSPSSSIYHQIFVKVFGIRGVHPDLLKAFPRGMISVSADLNAEKKETRRITIGGSQKANENSWAGANGVLKWDLKADDMKALKARQPMLRLDVAAHTEDESRSQSRGFIMIDVRDLERGVKNQWLKVSSLPGTEILLTAKLNTVLSGQSPAGDGSSPSSSPSVASDSFRDTSPSPPHGSSSSSSSRRMPLDVAASTESALSTLNISDDDPLSTDDAKFALSIAFTGFSNVTEYCKRFIDDDTVPPEEAEVQSFWLSWTVLGETFQSEEFSVVGAGPQRCRDTVRVRCSSISMLKNILSASPLQILLCTENKALAQVEVPLNYDSSVASAMDQPGNGSKLHLFPLQFKGRYSFTSLQHEFFTDGNVAAVEILVEAKVEEVVRKDSSRAALSDVAAAAARGGGAATASDAEDDTDGYNDSFEEDRSDEDRHSGADSDGPRSSSAGTGTKPRGVHFNEDGALKKATAAASSSGRRRGGGGGRKNDGGGGRRRGSNGDDDGTDGDEDEKEEDDSDADEYSRHFRVSVDVRSIGGLKRAANASVQFTYPFFGTGGPVRTHPIWLPANADGKIDNGSATYDCCMSRTKLRKILTKHPFKISVLSRTNLGSEDLAQVIVDLLDIYRSEPHSLRCPLTGRVFKTLDDYKHHRDIMIALRANGAFDAVPPKDPVFVWTRDLIIPLDADVGGRLRVVAFIEDLALVGSEKAVSVKPGYKMHNGALYPADDNGTTSDSGSERSPAEIIAAAGVSNLNQRASIGAGNGDGMQFTSISELQGDWEKWRIGAETQWREALREKELQMRAKLEADAASTLAARADDLRRAQEETGRLEVRLRTAIDAADQQKSHLASKEEQLQMKLAQKTAELQLLQRRVRDEAKARIEAETRRADGLATQVSVQKDTIDRLQVRIREAEREFENFRTYARSTPEAVLREEISRVKAQLGESRAEVERERRIRSEAELEKEHYRAQMHRLALALKRERERSSASARQELEQLRLEFLAREERYVLDGDRDELRTIRQELASLRSFTHGGTVGTGGVGASASTGRYLSSSQYQSIPSSTFATTGSTATGTSTGGYSEKKESSALPLSNRPPPPSKAPRPQREPVYIDEEHERSFGSFGSAQDEPQNKNSSGSNMTRAAYLHNQLEDLLATGFYDDPNDPVVVALRSELAREAELSGGRGELSSAASFGSASFMSASVTSSMEDPLLLLAGSSSYNA